MLKISTHSMHRHLLPPDPRQQQDPHLNYFVTAHKMKSDTNTSTKFFANPTASRNISTTTQHRLFNFKEIFTILIVLLTIFVLSSAPTVPTQALLRPITNENKSSANSATRIVRHATNGGNNNYPQTPPILSNFVALSNTSIRAFNAANGQLHMRVPLVVSNQSMLSDQSHSDESQTTRYRAAFEKNCLGTSYRFSGQANKIDHYQNLVERYKNCTHVIGNLEITWLETIDNKPLDLTFLESIREITGYLLIAYVDVERIRMPNLQIIRGRELFKLSNEKEEFAMFVWGSQLRSLELPNLREILTGSVGFKENYKLCHIRSIEWDEILNPGYESQFSYMTTFNDTEPNCPKCHSSCNNDACWGPGPELCQKFSKKICSPQCEKGRCFGSAPRECCHLFCAGGCTGPKQTDCLACKHFDNEGECIQECPSMRKYNPSKFIWETDPDGKYAFGATCVKECPRHLLRDNGACVLTCPPDKRNQNGECIACQGPCPKNCLGVTVNSQNIQFLVNCTEIDGSINILQTSFDGYVEANAINTTMGPRYEPMHPSKLSVFKSIKRITGHLNIEGSHPDFKDLSFFSNLEAIEGRQNIAASPSLKILKTSLVSLNLRSLKNVTHGAFIVQNKNMCFANVKQFVESGILPESKLTIRDNGDERRCRSLGLNCHNQCYNDNCWGPGQNECVYCSNYKLDDYCVQDCKSTTKIGFLSFDSGNKTCSKCHSECRDGCWDGNATSCWACKNNKDGPYCVNECPKHKYSDNAGVCQECFKHCVNGCTGSSSLVGQGGCNDCEKAIVDSISPRLIARCLRAEEPCPEGYYQEYVAPLSGYHPLKQFERKPICRKCNSMCKSCTGYGTHKDVCECAGYVADDQCRDKCTGEFYADEKTRRCLRCSRECNGCFGPTEADCLNCRVYRIYHEASGPMASARVAGEANLVSSRHNEKFNCTSQCPSDKPHRVSESNLLDPYCSEDPGQDFDNPRVVSVGSTSLLFLLITSASITVCVMVYKCKMDKDEAYKLANTLSGLDDSEPLKPSNLKPNCAPLISIKETDLRRGEMIGSGVGGTVYQGEWYPNGSEEGKQWVAIKILRDNGQPNRNKEFLDEAYIMSRVDHKNLVKLLAVCMTPEQLILVTPLMPVGCLLDYVKKYRNDIRSKDLLEWGKQIANGMAYLEKERLVHRDLALRNVLLRNEHHALISDFGLAKFLDVDQSEYKVAESGGTRLPIKWLAPECIRERKFTHKSDVWAFGVTIWELVTFGKRPFENYETNEVFMAVEKGARLDHPEHVSTEVYKEVMYACWFYNPDDRPNFKSLAEHFKIFARDPERYLICNQNTALRSSESDNNQYDDHYSPNSNSIDEETLPPLSAQPILGHHPNGSNDVFRYDTRPHHSESETPNGHLSTPSFKRSNNIYPNHHQMLEELFPKSSQQVSDHNNNLAPNNRRSNGGSCWTVDQTVSMNSLGPRSEQPTDSDDYLMPSPSSNEEKFTRFLSNQERQQTNRFPTRSPSSNDPPHSAGLIGISNQEYFLTRMNYANSTPTNASSSHIPQSLV